MADPVPLDIESYLEEKVLEFDDTFELREGSAFRDFFIKPLTSIIQPLRNDLETVRVLQSVINFEQMSDEEFDSLVANYFISRRSGSKSTGKARLVYASPRDSAVSQGAVVLSASGLRYLVDEDSVITSASMSVNVDGANYFFDVSVTAESPGEEFNIDRNNLVALESQVAGVIRVTNPEPFTGGLATESNFELFNRAQSAVTVRNLINDRSILTTLLETFDFITAVVPIGFNDPEMLRDLETIILPGPPQHPVDIHVGGKADIYTEVSSLDVSSVTVQSAPGIIDTNTDRGKITEIDFGFRRIAIEGGYFNNTYYRGDPLIDLLAFRYYTFYLVFNAEANQYNLASLDAAGAYPAYPGGVVTLGRVQTDGANVIEILDDRENVFTFARPLISLDSVEVLNPVSLQPTGVELRDGLTPIVGPSIVSDPGRFSHTARSRGSGDLHFVYKRSDGVYYSRLDSGLNEVQIPVLISSDTNASNLKISPTLQEDANVFFLDFSGNIRHLKIDPAGGVLVAENTVSGAGVTSEFDLWTDFEGKANLLSVNDDLGQPDLCYIRVGGAGAVEQAQVNVFTSASNKSEPDIFRGYTPVPTGIDGNSSNTGVTSAASVTFTDANATFLSDGVVNGDLVVLYSGDTPLPSAELGVYTVDVVNSEIELEFTTPVTTGSIGVFYEIFKPTGDLFATFADDAGGFKNIKALKFDTAGSVIGPADGVVLSDPTLGVNHTLPTVVARPGVSPVGVSYYWVKNQTEVQNLSLDNVSSWVLSTTGDTQTVGATRNFLDASNPFVPSDVGKFISITAGSGLTETDFRLYEILEYIAPGNVQVDIPVTESGAADIEYAIVEVTRSRADIAPNVFDNPVTSLDAFMDSSASTHISAIETTDNSGAVYLGKFNTNQQPLIACNFLLVKQSKNNQSSVNIAVDDSRQPTISWDDFTASSGQVQIAKYQAQEFTFVVNDRGKRLSIKEDNSIIFDPIFVGQSLRFNFTWSSLIDTVDDYINDTVNRVVIGDYLAKHTFPAFVDVDLVYSGANAPTEEDALTLITDYINSVGSTVEPPTVTAVITRSTVGDALEVSDLVDVLYDNGADSVRIGSELRVFEATDNGTFRDHRSIDKVTISRTSKYISRNITVTLES